jgi:hypothetical protein
MSLLAVPPARLYVVDGWILTHMADPDTRSQGRLTPRWREKTYAVLSSFPSLPDIARVFTPAG